MELLLIKYIIMELGIIIQVPMILWDIGDLVKEAELLLQTLPAMAITEPLVLFLDRPQPIQFGKDYR